MFWSQSSWSAVTLRITAYGLEAADSKTGKHHATACRAQTAPASWMLSFGAVESTPLHKELDIAQCIWKTSAPRYIAVSGMHMWHTTQHIFQRFLSAGAVVWRCDYHRFASPGVMVLAASASTDGATQDGVFAVLNKVARQPEVFACRSRDSVLGALQSVAKRKLGVKITSELPPAHKHNATSSCWNV